MVVWKASFAYVSASVLAGFALMTEWRATQVPWLDNKYGQWIGLWKFADGENSVEFPSRAVCESHFAFCANWKTATFMLTLALIPEALVLLSILFSWAFRHRKKTVQVAKYLLGASLITEICGTLFWFVAYLDLKNALRRGEWRLIGGWRLVLLSGLANLILLVLMCKFRSIVRSESIRLPEDNETAMSSSDEEYLNDEDDISVPDDIPADQIDFYIFNKRARRQALAQT